MTNMDGFERLAVVDCAYHGGGILSEHTSPREAARALKRHSDRCFDGSGCQSLAGLRGGQWWPVAVVGDGPLYGPNSRAGAWCVVDLYGEPLRDASSTSTAYLGAL